MSTSRQPGLDVAERVGESAATLDLGGELDISTAELLAQAVARACAAEEPRALVIDLRRLTFIDSSGLAAMLSASKLCERRGRRLSVIRGPQPVHQVFELTGLDRLLPFAADSAEPAGPAAG
jgi:anti-sigma B factor antagonist